MPTGKSHRRGTEGKNRRGKLAQHASSFHGTNFISMAIDQLPRPRTVPDLLPGTSARAVPAAAAVEARPKLTKLLLNVSVQRSLGPVQVIMSPELTVGDLIAAALRLYAKEGRRPILSSADPTAFDLHYSQFSLESLDREETLMALGSRNFFLCPKRSPPPSSEDGGGVEATASNCSEEAGKATKAGLPWLKFIDFLF